MGDVVDVALGHKTEDDRLHPGLGNRLTALGVLVYGAGHPDQLAVVQVVQIIIE